MNTLADHIKALIAQHGTLRAVSRATGVDVGYLSRLEHGEKTEPSDDTLAKLGLRRVTTYESIARGIEREARESEGPRPKAEEPGDGEASTRPEEAARPEAVRVERQEVREALTFIQSAVEFAYEQGLHEVGYDPVAVLSASLKASKDKP